MNGLGKYKNIIFDSETKKGIRSIKNIRKTNLNAIIVFASGCFDVAHSGHALFTEQMRQIGNSLTKNDQKVLIIVGLGKDEVLAKLKGESRPINPEWNRAYLLASYKEVDCVILDSTEVGLDRIDFKDTLYLLKPDIFVLNDDDSSLFAKKKLCKELGITFKKVKRIVPDFLKPTSSSQIIKKIAS